VAGGLRRRDFLPLVGVAAVAVWPLAAGAQRTSTPVVGFLGTGAPPNSGDRFIAAWRRGLSEAGFVEGRNLAVEYRWGGASTAGLPALAAELVGHPVDVIYASSGFAARAAKAATSIIPIMFSGPVDPVAQGLAENLKHPGGNLTGIAGSFDTLVEKRLHLLHELAPTAYRIGYLVNPNNPNPGLHKEQIAVAGKSLGIEVAVLMAERPEQLELALGAARQVRIDALLVADDAQLNAQGTRLLELSTRYVLRTMYAHRGYVVNGGLISYGLDAEEIAYQGGAYVARVLKGAKPADLPIMQPTRYQLVINLKTAKALGITIPRSILLRADRVIE
jgi:putative ABC transport system substrate-binding protein